LLGGMTWGGAVWVGGGGCEEGGACGYALVVEVEGWGTAGREVDILGVMGE